jgi:hypothetical protein
MVVVSVERTTIYFPDFNGVYSLTLMFEYLWKMATKKSKSLLELEKEYSLLEQVDFKL